MNEKAEPKLMDTGTIIVETKLCAHCLQPIEWVGTIWPADGRVERFWVHADDDKSPYCRSDQ